MQKLIQVSKLMMVAGVVAVVGFGVSSATARPPCICPLIYFPVICSNGHVYTNGCFASCAGATGCVPTGDPLIVLR
jgi:hypothetical protein